MLLIVPYKSVQYNYIIIMQWLVGLGIKAKWGLCQQKKCTVALCDQLYLGEGRGAFWGARSSLYNA